VSGRAWLDLDIRTRSTRFALGAPEVEDGHPILAKFWADCSHPEAVDAGVPLQGVAHPKVFRIRANGAQGSFRAAVWFDDQSSTLWLLRVVRLSDFASEEDAYAAFPTFERHGVLFPSEDERLAARQDALLANVVHSFNVATRRAFDASGSWALAQFRDTSRRLTAVGRVRVDIDADELIARQYLVIGVDSKLANELSPWWRQSILGYSFPPDELNEAPLPAYELPVGTQLQRHERAFMFDCYTATLREWLESPGRDGR
jgi:hypothetical protein